MQAKDQSNEVAGLENLFEWNISAISAVIVNASNVNVGLNIFIKVVKIFDSVIFNFKSVLIGCLFVFWNYLNIIFDVCLLTTVSPSWV